MSANATIIVALIGLILVVVTHIFVIARWSGRVDASLEAILSQPTRWTTDLTAMGVAIRNEQSAATAALKAELAIYTEETKRLRDARHVNDGKLQHHEGKFLAYDRALTRLEKFVDECERERRDRESRER